jgi:hypothetical protein
MSVKGNLETLKIIIIPERKVFLKEYFVHQLVVPYLLILPDEAEFTFPDKKEYIIDDIISQIIQCKEKS